MESYSEGPGGVESKLRPGVEATERFTLIIADRGGRERGEIEAQGKTLTRELEILETFSLGRYPAFPASHIRNTPSPYTYVQRVKGCSKHLLMMWLIHNEVKYTGRK